VIAGARAGEPVGLIAAGGRLPVEIAEGARRQGRPVICVAPVDGDPALREIAHAYYAVSIGELGAMIAALRRHAVREIVLAGKVDKLTVMRNVRFDAEGAAAAFRLAALGDLGDASILALLVAVLEQAGFAVASQTRYIGHLVPSAGVLGARTLTTDESRDAALGLRIARSIADLDVGQAVAVGRGVVVAVEAAEGTDAMIRRSGALADGIVVVKVSRPQQDPRYDLPVVGPGTVAALAEARGTALVVEAGRTILLERDALVAAADAAGIAVSAVETPGAG
jgi:DUF1009 family protein